MYRALIDLFECTGRGKNFYLVEGLRAVQALPMVYGPVFEIHLEAVIVFLKKVRSPAKGAHDRFHKLSSGPLDRRNLLIPAE
jgi:hypothetical protein